MGSHRQCSPPICGAWYRLYGVHGNIVGPSLSGVHGGPLGEQIVSSGGVARSALVGYLHFGGLHSGELHWPITGTWWLPTPQCIITSHSGNTTMQLQYNTSYITPNIWEINHIARPSSVSFLFCASQPTSCLGSNQLHGGVSLILLAPLYVWAKNGYLYTAFNKVSIFW